MDVYAYFTARGLGKVPGIFKAYTMFVIEILMLKKLFVFFPQKMQLILNQTLNCYIKLEQE